MKTLAYFSLTFTEIREKEGDLTALRLCLDRICPPRKSRPISIDLHHTLFTGLRISWTKNTDSITTISYFKLISLYLDNRFLA
jgi:hypothetical protein